MTILHKLKWRYAIKRFDSEKKIPEDQITELLKAVNLSASSFGLQPYELIVIHNAELQEKLSEQSYGQGQITSASHIIVFAAKKKINADYVSEYISRTEEVKGMEAGSLADYKDIIQGYIAATSDDDLLVWSQKQAYIALGTLLIAAADLKIDVCPMEGVSADGYDELLDLEKNGLRTTVIATLGYRTHDDKNALAKKSRKSLDELVQLKY